MLECMPRVQVKSNPVEAMSKVRSCGVAIAGIVTVHVAINLSVIIMPCVRVCTCT